MICANTGGENETNINYKFDNVVHTTVTPAGWQGLEIEQPLEVVGGVAIDMTPNG